MEDPVGRAQWKINQPQSLRNARASLEEASEDRMEVRESWVFLGLLLLR